MTAQELFDTVVAHLLKQNKKSLGTDGFCKYRGDIGLKCAIGVLIPDDKYKTWMDYDPTTGLRCVLVDIGLSEHYRLCGRLQNIHDSDIGAEVWMCRLQNLAKEFGLEFNQ
jgi:hypothetical protein